MKFLKLVLCLISPLFLTACFDSPEVKQVKTGVLQLCPSHSVDQMVRGFMGSPSWKSGKSEDGKHFVNVEGDITFHDKPVRAMVQFIVDGEHFSFNAFEMNGVPSAKIIAVGLLNKMCESAVSEPQSTDVKQESSAPSVAQPVQSTSLQAVNADTKSIALRGGKLSLVGQSGEMRLLLNETKLIEESYILSIEKAFSIGDTEIALVQKISGGTACPAQYVFVSVTAQGIAKVSPEFGTCSDLAVTTQSGSKIVVAMPKMSGGEAEYIFEDSTVKENGVPLR